MALTQHPSLLKKELMDEAIQELSKKELIEEVEWLKSQRDALLKELQLTHGKVLSLEFELREMKLNYEAKIDGKGIGGIEGNFNAIIK